MTFRFAECATYPWFGWALVSAVLAKRLQHGLYVLSLRFIRQPDSEDEAAFPAALVDEVLNERLHLVKRPQFELVGTMD